jgi:hypothetical protein
VRISCELSFKGKPRVLHVINETCPHCLVNFFREFFEVGVHDGEKL